MPLPLVLRGQRAASHEEEEPEGETSRACILLIGGLFSPGAAFAAGRGAPRRAKPPGHCLGTLGFCELGRRRVWYAFAVNRRWLRPKGTHDDKDPAFLDAASGSSGEGARQLSGRTGRRR